ncbi:hypothetical protein HYY75_04020 [bacterium]|nr:hypothetical protein [bacterium]
MNSRGGLSMVEVMFAVVIAGLALGPLISNLSSSNKASTASMYEVMAVHYANELSEQLRRLSPYLTDIQGITGQTLDSLLSDPDFNTELSATSQPPKGIYVPGTNVTLFLSPLEPSFYERKVDVRKIAPPAGLSVLNSGTYWDVKIILSWKLSPNEPVSAKHSANFSLILWEKP